MRTHDQPSAGDATGVLMDRRAVARGDGWTSEEGFTLVETLVATVVLAIAILLTVTPVMVAMGAIARSEVTTVAENLAQAEIETIRALDYDDIGLVGGAPDGIIQASQIEVIEGRTYTIDTSVQYVGQLTGLNIIPQGGDGVEGVFDPGVNYKYVTVTVTPADNRGSPVTMETIVSPPTIGALEEVAIASITVDRHEPYDPYPDPSPYIMLTGPWTYTAADNDPLQIFPDIRLGTYTISLAVPNGWKIHPESVASGANTVDATPGWNSERTIRVYRPASLSVTVLDSSTGLPITGAVVTALDLTSSISTTNAPGDYTFDDLVPDPYEVTATASGYAPSTVTLDVPGFGGGTSASATIVMDPQPITYVDWTFNVNYAGWTSYRTAGATVVVSHPTHGSFVGTTNEFGSVTLSIPELESGYSVTASTPWGHAPATASFSTGSTNGSMTLVLGKPGGTDRYRFRYGPPGPAGFYEYKFGSNPWVRVPANDIGRATIIVPENIGTTLQLAAYCSVADYPGSPMDTRSYSISGSNRTWNVSGSCP